MNKGNIHQQNNDEIEENENKRRWNYVDILFGDVPFTGLLSYPLLCYILSPEYETLIKKHSILIMKSIESLLNDPHFTIISFEEKYQFDTKIQWFSYLIQ